MNDRYLSRGKRLDNGEWITGYYVGPVGHDQSHEICDINDLLGSRTDVDPGTVGQCTGLHAAKSYRGEGEADRLIFEGDVLKTHYANAPKADHVEVVVFKNGKFMVEGDIGDTGKCWALLADGVPRFPQDKSIYMDSMEIISTIHDAPERSAEE